MTPPTAKWDPEDKVLLVELVENPPAASDIRRLRKKMPNLSSSFNFQPAFSYSYDSSDCRAPRVERRATLGV